MELFVIILLLFMLPITIVLSYVATKLAENVDKLETYTITLCGVQRGLDYVGKHFEDICEQHEEDVRKIQAEVLAADILKDKEG